jgi:hypothetical protein
MHGYSYLSGTKAGTHGKTARSAAPGVDCERLQNLVDDVLNIAASIGKIELNRVMLRFFPIENVLDSTPPG